jgi:U-box domain/Armadillo/beta-catenin-like repeat
LGWIPYLDFNLTCNTEYIPFANLETKSADMDTSLNLSFDSDEQSSDAYEEKAFDAFMCPLTRQVMRDPVTIESGQTFEREAILKWFKECRESGRQPTCPLTQKSLKSTELTPCISLRKAIEEWRKRREEKELEKARSFLTLNSSEENAVGALRHVINICQRNEANKDLVRNQGLIPMLVDMLRSSNRQVRLKALEALRVIAEENDSNQVRSAILLNFFYLACSYPMSTCKEHENLIKRKTAVWKNRQLYYLRCKRWIICFCLHFLNLSQY